MYEKEDNFKLGLEGYFTGSQYLIQWHQNAIILGVWFYGAKNFQKSICIYKF